MFNPTIIGSNPYIDVISGKKRIAKISLIDDQLIWQYDHIWQKNGYAISPREEEHLI